MEALREAGHRREHRHRPRPGQRLHPRPDLLLRALRRADRLGDDHPQPVRALAGRALPRGRRPPRCPRDHPGRRLRRALLGRPRAGNGAAAGRPPRVPPRRLDRGRAREARAGDPDRRAGRAEADPARLPVEPRPPRGRVRRPDPDPGGRDRRRSRSRRSGPSSRRCRPSSGSRTRMSPRSAPSATTPAAWR